jgi:hypothetical protein
MSSGPPWRTRSRTSTTAPGRSSCSGYNSHINQASGAHAASAVSYAGGGNWADGTTNPATTVEAQLDKIISDLVATAGAARVGAAAAGNLPAGTVRSQLDALDATSVRTNVANTFTALQTLLPATRTARSPRPPHRPRESCSGRSRRAVR